MEKSYKTSKHNLKSYNLNIINDFTDAFNWLINTVCHNPIFDIFILIIIIIILFTEKDKKWW